MAGSSLQRPPISEPLRCCFRAAPWFRHVSGPFAGPLNLQRGEGAGVVGLASKVGLEGVVGLSALPGRTKIKAPYDTSPSGDAFASKLCYTQSVWEVLSV